MLHNYIKVNESYLPKLVLENLLIKKYLLLALPEILEYEDYFLENKTLDNFDILVYDNEKIDENSFKILIRDVFEFVIDLDYNDYAFIIN